MLRFLARMTWPILLLSILTLAGGILAAWNVHGSEKDASDALARNVASMRAAEELVIAFHDVRAKLHLFLLTEDRRHLESVPGLRRGTDHWLDVMERTAVTERELELIDRVRNGYEQFFQDFDALLNDRAGGGCPRGCASWPTAR